MKPMAGQYAINSHSNTTPVAQPARQSSRKAISRSFTALGLMVCVYLLWSFAPATLSSNFYSIELKYIVAWVSCGAITLTYLAFSGKSPNPK